MQLYLIGFMMMLSYISVEVSAYPASNNREPPLQIDLSKEVNKEIPIDARSLPVELPAVVQDANTKEILEKIKAINEAIKKPHRRQQIKWNPQPQTGGGYIMDKEILEKLQEIIASGKLHGLPHHDNNDIGAVQNYNDIRYSRQLNFPINPLPAAPYIMPVMVVPGGMFPNYMNRNGFNYLRDGFEGSEVSQFQWPFASFFPILIRDPLLSIMNGGGWGNFIQYGQEADICRKQKSTDERLVTGRIENNNGENLSQELIETHADLEPVLEYKSRQSRSLRKRTVSQEASQQEVDISKNNKKTIPKKPTTTRKPVFSIPQLQQIFDPASKDDVRFGWFSGFNNNNNNNVNNDSVDLRRPVEVPTPGFFINRLRVRKGGVAIAGPGGVATAGRGGTAIVGPGGTALTQPGGMAVAGPAARVIALSPDADLSSIIKNLQKQQAASNGSVPFVHDIPEGRTVATGPVVYYHPKQSAVQYLPFYGGAKGQYLEIKKDTRGTVLSEKIVPEDKLSIDNSKAKDDENENVLTKILYKNLSILKRTSSELMKLINIGRKTGHLNNNDKDKFKTEMSSLAEAISNIIKVMDDTGDDINSLFSNDENSSEDNCSRKKPHNKESCNHQNDSGLEDLKEKSLSSLRRFKQQFDDDEEDVGEEGVGIDAADSGGYDDDGYDTGLIAEAKPVGLAVVGEHGLAASRPIGTAVAASGVAVARPIGTAIAGIDPQALGINFQVNHLRKH